AAGGRGGGGRPWGGSTTQGSPPAITGATADTRPSSAESCGATMPTTPDGSGSEKLKYGPATGLVAPVTWAILSVHPAYHTQRSIAASTVASARRPLSPSDAATSATNCARRPSSSSATRYSTRPRWYAMAADHFPKAARAALTASRTSLRDSCAALARNSPPGARIWYERPDSDRGKAPFRSSLDGLRKPSRPW